MKTNTPELLWHGGGNENGKPDPVYAVDVSCCNLLATAGIDASVPPKGSVRVSGLSILRCRAVVYLNIFCYSYGESVQD